MAVLRNTLTLLLVFVGSYTLFSIQRPLRGPNSLQRPYYGSGLYDWGLLGLNPAQHYQSFTGSSIKPNVIRADERCNDGLFFVEPLNRLAQQPFMIFDHDLNLVWTPTTPEWKNARDVKVQKIDGNSYITFLYGSETSVSGQGYALIDNTYRLYKTVEPVGILGYLSGLRLTSDGTALIIIHHASTHHNKKTKTIDTIFQEIDLDSGKLIFEWRASGFTHRYSQPGNPSPTFFQLQSVDKDVDGNYLVSSGNAIFCISKENGKALWQLGGSGNEFRDESAGLATSLSSHHIASWHNNTTLLVTNNNYGDNRRNLLIYVKLSFDKMTATVVKDVSPPAATSSKMDTFQLLGNDHILGQDTTTSKVVEFSVNDTLCEVDFAPSRLSSRWITKYHVSKYEWSAHPQTSPDIAVRPDEGAIYVSWNGATDIDSWILQSGPKSEGIVFIDHVRVSKKSFETRIELPRRTEKYIRVLALDKKWKMASHSVAVSRHIPFGGNRRVPVLQPLAEGAFRIRTRIVLLALVLCIMLYCYLGACLPLFRKMRHPNSPRARKNL